MPSKILIVDDQDTNRKAYKLTIEDSQLFDKIDLAENKRAAQRLIRKNSYDVILTDLIMDDDDDGINILKFAKQKDPLTMVLVITANDQKLERYRAFKMGAFDCISKSAPGVKSADEIIAKSKTALDFRTMALDQIEKEKNLNKLGRYFDPNIFQTLNRKPSLLLPTNKIVTIVFWDIRGFSKLSEILKAHPDLIAEFLKEYYELAIECIFNNDGVLDKFIGDGVMAIFGALKFDKSNDKQDAVNAAKSATEFNTKFSELHDKWLEKWQLYSPEKIEIGLGCGIHTGSAIVGNISTKIRDDFTALGSSVNLASRVESRSKMGQILVSTTTNSRISSVFKTHSTETLRDIKNIPGDYEIFEIVSD